MDALKTLQSRYIDLSFIVSLRSQRDIVFKERLDARTPQTAHEQHALS